MAKKKREADRDKPDSRGMDDPKSAADGAEAFVVLAEHAPGLHEALEWYQKAVAAGQRSVGPEMFRRDVGHFWGIISTRPYMRARLGLAQCLWELNRHEEAVQHYREMLDLNPHDHQGVRYLLAAALVELGGEDELVQLLARYPGDDGPEWYYTKALLAYRRCGDSEQSRDLLLKAVECNAYVPDYLLDLKPAPTKLSEHISRGSREEAIAFVGAYRRGWRATPRAIAWLRKVLQISVLPQLPAQAPQWRELQPRLAKLPLASDEVWQIDSRPLAMEVNVGRSNQRPWAMVVADQTNRVFLGLEGGPARPRTDDAWNFLVQTMRKPRAGDPRRPAEIVVRLKSYAKAWHKKLAQIGIVCSVAAKLEMVDRALAQTRIAPPADHREPDAAPDASDDPRQLRRLPQRSGEVWQAGIRHLLGWVEEEGEALRPWGAVVVNREDDTMLGYDLAMKDIPPDWLWRTIARAMCEPAMGQPHRPALVQVESAEQYEGLQPHLEACGIECVVIDDLERVSAFSVEMARSFPAPVAMTALVDVPGMSLEQVEGFFAAATQFYGQSPWRHTLGDSPIRVACDKFQSGPWYAIVMGQSGITLGLALHEGFEALSSVLYDDVPENVRHTSAISVTFGEAFEIAVRDLDAAEQLQWPVASPDAYPCAMRINPGRTVRPPLVWELELLEGCLRAVPKFVRSTEPSATCHVPAAGGQLTLRLSWVNPGDEWE